MVRLQARVTHRHGAPLPGRPVMERGRAAAQILAWFLTAVVGAFLVVKVGAWLLNLASVAVDHL